MASVVDTVLSQLTPAIVNQISNQVGADQNSTNQAIQLAVPLIVAALAKNSSTADGATSLTNAVRKDHDGSILTDLLGAVTGYKSQQGDAILGHVLGGQRPQAEQAIQQSTGVDAATLLPILAPIIMGVLGNMQRKEKLDSGGVADALRQDERQIEQQQPDLLSTLNSVLDVNRDGSALDDVAGMLGRFFNNRK